MIAFLTIPVLICLLGCATNKVFPEGTSCITAGVDQPALSPEMDEILIFKIRYALRQIHSWERKNGLLKAQASLLLPAVPDKTPFIETAVAQIKNKGQIANGLFLVALLGPLADSAVPEIIAAYDRKNLFVKKPDLLQALGQIGPKASEATYFLSRELFDPDESVRAAAAEALGRIGERSLVTRILLTNKGHDESQMVRTAALLAKWRIWKSSSFGELSSLATIALDSKMPAVVRESAAGALAEMGIQGGGDACHFLQNLLESENAEVRICAAERLVALGMRTDSLRKSLLTIRGKGDHLPPETELRVAAALAKFPDTRVDALRRLEAMKRIQPSLPSPALKKIDWDLPLYRTFLADCLQNGSPLTQ